MRILPDERGNINGYVVYPSATYKRDMEAACELAEAESLTESNGSTWVIDSDEGETIASYYNGMESRSAA